MKLMIPAMAAALVMVTAAACSGSAKAHPGGQPAAQSPQVTITPADGSAAVRPDTRIVVRAVHGTLDQVAATSLNHDVDGQLSADHTTWQATWMLTPGAPYTITARAVAKGAAPVTVSSSFRAAPARGGLEITDVSPQRNWTVGIGMPIIVTFDRKVADRDRAALEKSFVVRSTQPHEGAWNWVWDGETQQAIFRLHDYWQPHEHVTFTAHLAGLHIGSGFGAKDVTHTFQIGDDHRVLVDDKTHRLTATSNGVKVKSWGVSLGTGGEVWSDGIDHLVTTSGTHLVMDHERIAHMVSPGKTKGQLGYYEEDVPWATRISNSGEYIHQTMGEEECLGVRNCSHGCVRSPGPAAEWFYTWSHVGDVVTIEGTSRRLLPSDGWGASYQVSWDAWLKGSALGTPVSTVST